ncbi:hypothetical protein NMG60_11037144 [Bertholletia excelsa]
MDLIFKNHGTIPHCRSKPPLVSPFPLSLRTHIYAKSPDLRSSTAVTNQASILCCNIGNHSKSINMSAARAWIVAASIGAVEALKDQGFCRWNYAMRCVQQHAKNNLRSYCQVERLSASSPAAAISAMVREEKAKRTEEKIRKVMDLDCFGPSTLRF